MKDAVISATILLLGIGAAPAKATTAVFNWVTTSNSNTVLGLIDTVTNNGITLTAYGLTASTNLTAPATAGPALYAKNGGTGETGLGMAVDPGNDHEISAPLHDGIQIDFSNPLSLQPAATVTMQIESVQSGEGWALYGSNTLLTIEGSSKTDGFLGEPLASGVGPYPNSTVNVTLPDWGEFTYYTLMATGGTQCSDANILLGTVTINGGNTPNTPTPEPGTLLMAGTTFIGLGLLLKKRQAKA